MLMVGGAAAAARLFHTLRIYIFTAAPEWPVRNVFTHQLNAQFFLVFRFRSRLSISLLSIPTSEFSASERPTQQYQPETGGDSIQRLSVRARQCKQPWG